MQRVYEAFDDLLGNRVFQLFLDRPAEISRAVGHGVGLFDQRVNHALVPDELQTAFGERLLEIAQHDDRNRAEVLLGELVEADHLVDTVDELRS